MSNKWRSIITVIALVVTITSCSPKATPAPISPGATLAPRPVEPTAQTPISSPEEMAWAKVVEDGKKEGKVVFYSASFSDAAVVLGDTFFQKYGIKVEIIAGQGATHYERLRTEKRMGQMTGDVVAAGPAVMMNMKEESLLAKATDLPTIQNKALWDVDPLVFDPDGYVPAFAGSWFSPLINTRLVREGSEPKSLRDFLKPEWKGKIVSVTPLLGANLNVYYVTFVNRNLIDWSYVEALGKQIGGWLPNIADVARSVAKGDFPVTQWTTSTSGAPFVAEGAPIKALSMEEGDPFSVSVVSLVNGAPHPNAAKVFVNWWFGEEAALLMLEKTKTGSESLLRGVPSGTPKVLIPPLKKKIVVTKKDNDDGTKLNTERFLAELWGVQK